MRQQLLRVTLLTGLMTGFASQGIAQLTPAADAFVNSGSGLPPDNWSGVNDTLRPILGREERCGRVGLRRSRSSGC